jgi:acyl-CoA synthetase (AMP-forming)/AMP-acid ligase II
MNIGFLLTNSASKYPERTAIVSDEGRLSFRELETITGRLAGAMLKAGLKKGDRAAILFFNSLYFVEIYFAALKAGIVPVPVNFRLAGPEIVHILNDSRSNILFYGPEFEETLLPIREQLSTVKMFVSPQNEGSPLAADYDDFLNKGDYFVPSKNVSEEDWCQIIYTSGTTGKPKGAVLTHSNILWNFMNTMIGREDYKGERAAIPGPLYHTAALNNHLTIQIALGGTSIILRKFDPESMLRIIEEEGVTLISGAPALFNMLLQYPDSKRFDTSSVTKCTAGSDKLPMEVKKRLLEFFPNIKGVYDVYGCTEASPSIAILNARDSLRKDGSVGRPLPFLDARVIDEGGGSVSAGEVGELICRGPNVMEGYYGNPEGTAEAIRDGWLYTGDLARMDEEGFLYIVDRKKDMILSGGENIYPRELEEVLIRHPAVVDVTVVGVPDPDWGEAVKAFIVRKDEVSLDEETVVNYCKEHLASYKKPKHVEFISTIPRNPSGKVLKRLLREKGV